MSAETFAALPDEGFERTLIKGRVWERPWQPKDRWHAQAIARISSLFMEHLAQSKVGGELLSSCDCFRLRRSPDTVIGIDIAYLSAASVRDLTDDETFVECVPTLAIQVLALDDCFGQLVAMVAELFDTGTPMVWIVDPHFRTVVVHRADRNPKMLSGDETVSADPFLPGFRVKVSDLFGL